MTTETPHQRDWRLREYIRTKHHETGQTNAADHRPTFQDELDAITAKADKLYARGQEFLQNISDREKAQMRAYHNLTRGQTSWTSPDELVQCRIGDQWMLVPFFIADIERARTLRDILSK